MLSKLVHALTLLTESSLMNVITSPGSLAPHEQNIKQETNRSHSPLLWLDRSHWHAMWEDGRGVVTVGSDLPCKLNNDVKGGNRWQQRWGWYWLQWWWRWQTATVTGWHWCRLTPFYPFHTGTHQSKGPTPRRRQQAKKMTYSLDC